MKALKKYLEFYSDRTEPSAFPFLPVRFGVLIPCFGEKDELLRQLQAWKNVSESFLLILIINEAFDSEEWAKDSNRSLLEELRRHQVGSGQKDFYADYLGLNLKILDRTQDHSLSEGVGEARKIGADYLLKLHLRGDLLSEFIFSTDADTLPQPCYFESAQFFTSRLAAVHFDFEHFYQQEIVDKSFSALTDYELSLRYYAWGLRSAGSPYCYPSIGSCLIINLNAYVKARGFPQKKAGEDFYLLNKLRKLGPIRFLPGFHLKIEARNKVRTPFGTTAALQKNVGEFFFYSPEVFKLLKDFLTRAEEALIYEQDFKTIKDLWPTEEGQPDLEAYWDDLRQSSSEPNARLLQFHTWFDGFKTLRFIQALTRQRFPKGQLSWELKEEIAKSLESPNFLNSLLELSLLDYSRNRVDQLLSLIHI